MEISGPLAPSATRLLEQALNLKTSYINLHILGSRSLVGWQKIVKRLSPAHSNRPLSRDTLKVISVGFIGTDFIRKKRRKLGYVDGFKTIWDRLSGSFSRIILTYISYKASIGWKPSKLVLHKIQDQDSRIDRHGFSIRTGRREILGVCMAANARVSLVKVDFMFTIFV